MRFTLLCASTALAASLVLSACSGGAGSSSAIPGGASASAPMAHHGAHLVSAGGSHRPQSCTSPYYICYLIGPGESEQFGWCISYSGNCTSGVLTDKIKWTNDVGGDNACGITAKTGIGFNATGGCTGKVKAVWGPPKAVVGVQYETVSAKANVKYTDGQPGYDASWNACSVKGNFKGDCFGPELTGVIVGPY